MRRMILYSTPPQEYYILHISRAIDALYDPLLYSPSGLLHISRAIDAVYDPLLYSPSGILHISRAIDALYALLLYTPPPQAYYIS